MHNPVPFIIVLFTYSVLSGWRNPVVAEVEGSSVSPTTTVVIPSAALEPSRLEIQLKPHLMQIKVGQTASSAPESDELVRPLLKKRVGGKLAYTYIKQVANSGSRLAVLDCVTQQATDDSCSLSTYSFRRPEWKWGEVYNPQWSPNGRYLLLKVLPLKGHSVHPLLPYAYNLFVLDTQTHVFKLVSDKELTYFYTLWAPDSTHVAFVAGGDALGRSKFAIFHSEEYIGPRVLYIANWRTGELSGMITDDFIQAPFSWLPPHTLLYDRISEKWYEEQTQASPEEPKESPVEKKSLSRGEEEHSSKSTPAPVPSHHPVVYQYLRDQRGEKELVKDAFRPVSSPDGKWIAFFGSENPAKPQPINEHWRYEAKGLALSVIRSDGTERRALNREQGLYPLVQWLPNSKSIVTLKQIKKSPQAEAEVKKWDIATGQFRKLATIKAHDYEAQAATDIIPYFNSFGIDASGLRFFVGTTEVEGYQKRVYPLRSYQLTLSRVQVLDLESGATEDVVHINNTSGFDWIANTDSLTSSSPIGQPS